MPAIIEAVETQDAFTDSEIVRRLARAFAIFLAEPAFEAFGIFLSDAPNSESVNESEERSERTDKPAIKSRNNKIQ